LKAGKRKVSTAEKTLDYAKVVYGVKSKGQLVEKKTLGHPARGAQVQQNKKLGNERVCEGDLHIEEPG